MTQKEFLDAMEMIRMQNDIKECQRLIRQSAKEIEANKKFWELKKEEMKWWRGE